MNIFTKNLKTLRLQNGYTQKQVAEKVGMTYSAYKYCESGNFPEKYEQFINICRLYNIDSNKLLGIEIMYDYPKFLNKEIEKDEQDVG